MTTLEKIKAEIDGIEINGHIRDVECFRAGINTALNVIDKYVEQKNCDTCINNGKCSPQIREIVRKNGCPKWTPNKDMYEPLLPMGKYPKTSFPCDLEDDVKQTKQKPCDDVVSRQAVYEILEGNWNTDFLHSEVERLPSVQPKAKTGIWEFAYRFHRKCSVCGEVVNISEDDNYCHKCGAKMEREPNDHLSQF